MLQRELLQDSVVGRAARLGLLDLLRLELELVEQDGFELPRRGHVELVASELGAQGAESLELRACLLR